mmetsp:Transcript_16917/g.39322  ORF Transcript_16917/g.39322 Transcript_16917/m.39322 type:complete len:212 (-) Transcript_16917:144-779(-)
MAVTGDAIPSAPPLSELGRGGKEDIPLVQASLEGPPNSSHPVATDAIQPENLAGSSLPPGMMVAKSVTTTYPDGRTTVTEYAPMNQGPTVSRASAPVAASMARPGDGEGVAAAAPAVNQSTYPRRDLGTRPATVTCPYCRHTGKTRIDHIVCGESSWMSIAVVSPCICCWPLFWIPFICPVFQDVEHSCSNCGRRVGKSKAEAWASKSRRC